MGHRGAPSEAPENSLASFSHAVDAGVDAIELDVQLTGDHHLAVVHDWSLERLAHQAIVVERAAWDRLRDIRLLDAAGETSRETIPDLGQVFQAVPDRLPINVELKRRNADPEALLDAVCPVLDTRRRCWVSSFDWDVLRRLHERRPGLPLAPLTSRRRRQFEPTAKALDAVALHCATRALSRAMLRRSRKAGRPVLIYTVDDPQEAAALFELGVAGVFSNEARHLIRSRR